MPEVRQTSTEMLIKVFEDFANDEPEELMVIFTDKGGNIAFHSNTDSTSKKLGLIEFAKAMILKSALL